MPNREKHILSSIKSLSILLCMHGHNTIVLVGIGGTGMSGLAHILLDLGYTNIVGIDSEHSQLTDTLEQRGISIVYGHGNHTLQGGDIVVYSAATADSLEVQQAIALLQTHPQGMLVCNYFQFLGEISKHCRTLAIAGTNGKSTTTALALYASKSNKELFELGILGATVPDLDGKSYCINPDALGDMRNIFDHILFGKGLDYTLINKYIFIVEACEYRRHFLHLDPDYTVITSMELDHTDYYTDMLDYQQAFVQLVEKTKYTVFLAPDLSIDWIPATQQGKCQIVSLQYPSFDYVFGQHYAINTSLILPALAILFDHNIPLDTRGSFRGLRRRMEYLADTVQGAALYSDYAHMPSSIDIVYQSLHQQFPDKKICAVFQPHQVYRLLQSRDDFVRTLGLYDATFLFTIYTAREAIGTTYTYKDHIVGTATDIGHAIATDIGCDYRENFDALWKKISLYDHSRIVVLLSAGDLDYYVRNILKDKDK